MVTCPFNEIGCKVKMKRCNLKKHLDSNFSQHQTFISTTISTLQKDGTTIKKDFQLNSQQTSTQLELTKGRISSLEEKCSNLDQELHDITDEVRTQNEQLTEELDQIQSYVEHLFTNYTELHEELSLTRKENELLRRDLDSAQSKCSTLEIKVSELKSQLAKTNHLSAVRNAEVKETLSKFMAETKKMIQDEVTNKITSLESTMSEKHLHVDYWIDGYKLMAVRMKEVNWELYLKTMAEIATQFPEPISPVILHVNGYEQAKRQAYTLTTSSFYLTTIRGKYKFILVINFTPDSMVVSASLTRGKYDDYIIWPFTGTIVVTLLNQLEDKNHYSKEIWSSADNPGFKYAGKPSNQLHNLPWSRQNFIRYVKLGDFTMPQCFLMNDSLYFEVNNSTQRDNASNNCTVS